MFKSRPTKPRPNSLPAKKNEDIQGVVENIEHLKITGWAFSRTEQPIEFHIKIDGTDYPVTAAWHDRHDVANQFGDARLASGFEIDMPAKLSEALLTANQAGRSFAVTANRIPLVNNAKQRPAPAAVKSGQPQPPAVAALDDALPPSTPEKAPLPPKVASPPKTDKARWAAHIPAEVLAELPDDVSEALLAHLANTVFKQLSSAFIASLGDQGQANIPPPLAGQELESFLAHWHWPPSLKVELTDISQQLPLLLGILSTLDNVEGFVETMEHIKVGGWAVRKDGKPAQLTLAVGQQAYTVSPVWRQRPDVSAQFGQRHANSGFEFLVPDEAIDAFLQARLGAQPIDLYVDCVRLKKSQTLLRQLAPPEPDSGQITAEDAQEAETQAPYFSFKEVAALNAKMGVEVSNEEFQQLLAEQITVPVRISDNDAINAHHYFELAKKHLVQHQQNRGKTLLKISLHFEKRAEFLEMLGNIYLEQGDYETANSHYETALASPGRISKWLFSNLERCKKRLTNPKTVVETWLAGIEHIADNGAFRDRLDEAMHEYWLKQQGVLEVLAVTDDRHSLVAEMIAVSSFIYNAYLRFYGATQNPQSVASCNLARVLIVGDCHIPQCVRYRIDQKVEQLVAAGKEVSTVSWTDLANHQKALALHDMVIFYRVPAEVPVLKAMAQVNATGKLSIYEIDDLLFEPSYPPPLETYGGYLGIDLYLQLLKGMGSFNAAARHCRFGLASTRPLAERLQTLVFGGRCFLHRNGLDSLNIIKPKTLAAGKTTLDIFYGSGTMAHNSDFIELVLPALARVLDEHPQTRLVIVGYLKLPAQFKKNYAERLKLLPPVKSVKAYWSLLEHADINLAVLHDDLINGCKSELKWFEAACLGIPSIVSTTANYRDVINDGEDGLLAATADDWYRQLTLLVEQPELRQRLAKAAQTRAKQEYGVPALAANIKSVLEEALAADQPQHLTKRPKLCLVNVFFPPQAIGGATRVVSDNFERLIDEYADRFEVVVFTSHADHKPPYQMDAYSHKGARVCRTTVQWREHMDWHPQDEQVKALFAEFLRLEQPDLIHFHCVQRLGASIIEAAQKANIPYLVTVHDAWWISDYQFLVDANNKVYPDGHPDIYEERVPPANISHEASMERTQYLKGLLHGAQTVLTVSNRFAEIYRKNGIPQIKVNKNGVSPTIPWQPKNTRHKAKVVCGHVGGMAEHKGYFVLKDAVMACQPRNIELLVVDHSQEEGYHHQILWGKVPVTFIGRVRQAHIVGLYQQIDVLFAPSKWPESFGLVTREAAACGCWVVASNLGGIGEDVVEGECGFVIEPTTEALESCLETIDGNPDRFKGLAKHPPLRSASEQVSELVEFYQDSLIGPAVVN